MEINAKSLPFAAIIAMAGAILSLCGYIVVQHEHAETVQREHAEEMAACSQKNVEAEQRLTAYVIRQDSINRAHIAALSKIQRK